MATVDVAKYADMFAALGAEPAVAATHVEEPAEPVVLGLEYPGRIVEWHAPENRDDRLDHRECGANS